MPLAHVQQKEGPPFKETAAKYNGKADALKTKNQADVLNVLRCILSR